METGAYMLCKCKVMSAFVKAVLIAPQYCQLPVTWGDECAGNLCPGFLWLFSMEVQVCWRDIYSTVQCVSLRSGLIHFWTSSLPPVLVIPSIVLNVLVSEICKAAFAIERAQGSSLFPACKYSSKWPMLQEPWGLLEFFLQVLAGTSDLRASKTCSLFHVCNSTSYRQNGSRDLPKSLSCVTWSRKEVECNVVEDVGSRTAHRESELLFKHLKPADELGWEPSIISFLFCLCLFLAYLHRVKLNLLGLGDIYMVKMAGREERSMLWHQLSTELKDGIIFLILWWIIFLKLVNISDRKKKFPFIVSQTAVFTDSSVEVFPISNCSLALKSSCVFVRFLSALLAALICCCDHSEVLPAFSILWAVSRKDQLLPLPVRPWCHQLLWAALSSAAAVALVYVERM